MKIVTRITFWDEKGEKFFGEGPARLMRGIEKTGSLRAAALDMDMAYTKALKILKNAENSLGFPLTTRIAGGKSGGGSVLTDEGKAWLIKYEEYKSACEKANQELFSKFYPKVGCVIMASGLGVRFGSNKLLADFKGKPLFMRALEISESFKDNRIVVTRHKEIAEICREREIKVILHELPEKSDTIKLGLEALENIDACFFLPSDQPLLKGETLNKMVKEWEKDNDKIIRPFSSGTPGAPVLFPKWCFSSLLNLPKGKGGAWVIKENPEKVKAFEIENEFELMDADTPETLEYLKQHI